MQYKAHKIGCPNANHVYNSNLRAPCTVVHVELVTSWPVIILWILLSFLVAVLASTAYVHPEWFVREHDARDADVLQYQRSELASTLGMTSVCYQARDIRGHEMDCHHFGEDFPSVSWQTSYVLFGSGCVLLTWCAIFAFCSAWMVGRKNRQTIVKLVGRVQLVAVILQSFSLLLYPLVLGSPFARMHCGSQTDVYETAGCKLGWAYVAAITSTVLSIYCPLLAHFTHYNTFSPCLWSEI